MYCHVLRTLLPGETVRIRQSPACRCMVLIHRTHCDKIAARHVKAIRSTLDAIAVSSTRYSIDVAA